MRHRGAGVARATAGRGDGGATDGDGGRLSDHIAEDGGRRIGGGDRHHTAR
jgi:hypothetical protein